MQKVGGRRFGLESCGIVAQAIRCELQERYGRNAPEWIIGHARDGTSSKQPRPAYLPLGFVGHEHADGHLLGIAVVLPQNFEHTEQLLDLLGRHDGNKQHDAEPGVPYLSLRVQNPQLNDRAVGNLDLRLDERPERERQAMLRSFYWTQPTPVWTTVTPLILPQHPGPGLTAEELVSRSCVDSGYPEPAAVRVTSSPLLTGVPHARAFHLKPPKRRPQRPLVHAQIEFPFSVRGPVLIGPGRCAGYGTFHPSLEERSA
jgi:CRISPR-associated protein Csb2